MHTPLTLRFLSALDRTTGVALAVFLAVALVGVPLLHSLLPPESLFHVSTYAITLIGKIMCYAIVAVGGRGTLIGPIIGAFVVNLAKSWFTVSFPEYWLFFLGLLFIVVTLLLPQGLIGLWKSLRQARASKGEKV